MSVDRGGKAARWCQSAPLLCCLLGGGLACGDSIGSPSGAPVVVIQGLLVADRDGPTVRVEWSVPSDSLAVRSVTPVPAAEVKLTLTLPSGRSTPFIPVPNVPGLFAADTRVEPGGDYRISGRVAGVPVAGEATVPAELTIVEPAADTLRLANSACFFCDVGFRWSAPGAVAYDYSQSLLNADGAFSRSITRDTVGRLALFGNADTTRLRVLAYDENAAAFLLSTTPRSNLTGAFGFLGAASAAERVVIWR